MSLKLNFVLKCMEDYLRGYCKDFGWKFRQFSFDGDKWLVTLKLSTLKGKILFGMLNDMLSDFSAKFGMKHEFFLLNASCEGLLVKFLVPYLRKLKQSEVLHILIIVESEYKDYFPLPMVELHFVTSVFTRRMLIIREG